MNTCPCGIARVDCEYHRPEPEPAHDDERVGCHAGRHSFPQRNGLAACWCGEPPTSVNMLDLANATFIGRVSSDCDPCLRGTVLLRSDCGEYVRTYRDGKLVDEEPAEAYKDHTIDAMVQSYKSLDAVPSIDEWLPRGMVWPSFIGVERLRGFKVPV